MLEHLADCPRCRVDRRLVRAPTAEDAPGLEAARASFSNSLDEMMGSLEDVWRSSRSSAPEPSSSGSDGGAGGDVEVRLPAGTRIGPFTVEGLLGQGGMAVVYLVRHRDLGTEHALKLVRATSASVHKRLRREGRHQARLRHPNVLPVTEVLEVNGAPALLLDRARGPSLARVLREGPLRLSDVDALGDQILAGVASAHAHGVVHRDLKPANVLLDIDEESGAIVARVADFGLVKSMTEHDASLDTRTGAVLGTPSYMAPEQLRDASRADARSDVFALGALLFELITGVRAFGGMDFVEVVRRVTEGLAPAIDALRPGVPERMRHAVAAALQVDPALRPTDAAALRLLWGDGLPRLPLRDPVLAARWLRLVEVRALPASTGAPQELSTEVSVSTARATPHGLAPESDGFVGRLSALADLDALAAAGQLVTVVGPGGVGKTRLLQHLAWTRAGRFPGGVWFVDARGATTLAELAVATARALSLVVEGDAAARVGDVLAHRGPVLLILDNLEQVVAGAAELIDAWRRRAPQLAIIATSRVVLHARDERVLPLDPLNPEEGAALLLQRARAVRPGFDLTPDDREPLGRLVAELDGLPLAIELAAARLRFLSLEAVLARMSERFRLLAGGRDRHATLDAVLEDSWQNLAPWEQGALAQCSVFPGSFSMEAAEAVVDASAWLGAPWPLDILQALVDASMIRARPDAEDDAALPRLHLLVSVRHFASARLVDPQPAQARHGAFYARWGTPERLAACRGAEGASLARERAEELDNITVACWRGVERRDVDVAVGALLAAAAVLRDCGPLATAESLARAVLTLPEVTGPRRAAAVEVLGVALHALGRAPEAHDVLLAGLSEASDDASRAALCCELAGACVALRRWDDARAGSEQAIALARAAGAVQVEARALSTLAQLASEAGRPAEALELSEEVLALARRADDQALVHGTLANQALLCAMAGRQEDARDRYERVLSHARRSGDRAREAMALAGLGVCHIQAGEPEDAVPLLRRATHLARDLGDVARVGSTTADLGWALADAGLLEASVAAYDEALAVWRKADGRSHVAVCLSNSATVLLDLGRFDEGRRRLEEALEIARSEHARMAEAATLGALAGVARIEGRLDEALRLIREALPLAEATHAHLYVHALGTLSRVQLARGEHAGALVAAEEVAERSERMGVGVSGAWTELAAVRLLVGTLPGALDAARRALDSALDPSDRAAARAVEGAALARAGSDPSAAFAEAEAHATDDPGRRKVRVFRALAAHGAEAVALLDEALALADRPLQRAEVESVRRWLR